MSAFDALTKIKLAVPDPQTDHTLPHPRSLGWTAITKPAALKGTIGSHCELIHGDRWHHVTGSHMEFIDQNQTHTVGANQTIKVCRNHKETIVGQCYQNVIGPHTLTNQNVVHETRMGTHTQDWGDFWNVSKYNGEMVSADSLFTATIYTCTFVGFKTELDGINFTGGGAYITAWIMRLPLMAIHWGACGVDLSQKAVHIQNEAFTARVHTVVTQLSPGTFDMITRLDGSIDIGSGTPTR